MMPPAALEAVDLTPRRQKVLNGNRMADLPPEELDRVMGPKRSHDLAMLMDWLIRHAREAQMPAETIAHLCEKLVGLGVPLDRYGSSVETLDAEHDAIGRLWLRGVGVTERTYVQPAEDVEEDGYRRSPFFAAAQTRQWVELWLPETEDSAFGIVPELKTAGFVHYFCIPIVLINGTNAWVTFATRQVTGFSTTDVAAIARLVPTLAIVIDFRSTWVSLQSLLRTYVGAEPQQAILRGNTKRGQVSTIRSAMLFADMRNSVGHTANLSAEQAVGVFNALFDCLVPPIETRGGEVLKYIGDGLLAIFRESKDGPVCNAAERALMAAEDALRGIAKHNLAHPDSLPMHVGIALHYGEAAYGNVGSGVRLDFTVIGRDVGLASRIANMNRPLGQSLLMSAPFVEKLRRPARRLGAYPARGFDQPLEVFIPGDIEETEA